MTVKAGEGEPYTPRDAHRGLSTCRDTDGTDLTDLTVTEGTPTLSSDMLTFTVDNWNTAQTVTVKAGQDNDGVQRHRDADAHRLGRRLRHTSPRTCR